MANGHIVIHDPMSNNNLTSNSDCETKSTSDTDSMRDTEEFRLIKAYVKRRQLKEDVQSSTQDSAISPKGDTDAKRTSLPQTPAKADKEEEKKKRKKKGWKRLSSILPCIKPQTVDEEPRLMVDEHNANNRRGIVRENDERASDGAVEQKEEDKLEVAINTLTEISDGIPFLPPDVESDSPEDDVEKVIALLLREVGDKVDNKALSDALNAREIFWNYSFFKMLITTLLRRMGLISDDPDALGPHASLKTQIAVTCEVTSRLSAVDTLPMNRMLDHGARYLRDNYSSWAQRRGGFEEAFYSDDEDDIQ